MKQLVLTTTVALTALLGLTARADTAKLDQSMAPVLSAYLDIQKALAGDSDKGVPEAARKLEAAAAKIDVASVKGEHAAHFKGLPGTLKAAAAKLAAAKGLEAEREAFKEVSKPMAMWATMTRPAGVYVAYCPMAKSSWLQPAKDIANPFYGSKMLTCGEITSGPDVAAAPAMDSTKQPPVKMKDMKKMPMKMERAHQVE